MADETVEQQQKEVVQDLTRESFETINRLRANTRPDASIAEPLEQLSEELTYRQSDDYRTLKKADMKFNMLAVASVNYHDTVAQNAFNKLTSDEQDALVQEVFSRTEDSLRKNLTDPKRQGFYLSDDQVDAFIKDADVCEKFNVAGYVTVPYEVPLEADDVTALTDWINHQNDPDAYKYIRSFSDKHPELQLGGDAHKAEIKIRQLLANKKYLNKDIKSSVDLDIALDQKGRDLIGQHARNLRVEADKKKTGHYNLSAVEKRTIIDAKRKNELSDIAQQNTALQEFINERTKDKGIEAMTASDWRKALSSSSHLDKTTKDAIRAVTDKYGQITEKELPFQRNASWQIANAMFGDQSVGLNVMHTGYEVARRSYSIGYRISVKHSSYLTKEQKKTILDSEKALFKRHGDISGFDASTAEGRFNLRQSNREVLHDAKEAKREAKFNKKHGKDIADGKMHGYQKKTLKHKNFDDTFRAKFINAANNNPIFKGIGKIFDIKNKIFASLKKLASHALKAFGMFYLKYCVTCIIASILLTALFCIIALFGELEPEYGQNIINQLNRLDTYWMQVIKNEGDATYSLRYSKTKPKYQNPLITPSIYESPVYDTNIDYIGTQIGQYVDEYGNEIVSANNILPILAAYRYRTGDEINKESWLSAYSYGKIMYWRTHKVSDTIGDEADNDKIDLYYDTCKNYIHGENQSFINVFPKDSKGYCDTDCLSIDNQYSLKCTKYEHTHGDGNCNDDNCEHECDSQEGRELGCIPEHDETAYYCSNLSCPHCYNTITEDDYDEYDGHCPYCNSTLSTYTYRVNGVCYHQHDASCCSKYEHTHDDTVTIDEQTHTVTTPCYNTRCYCTGHCAGHLLAQKTVTTAMDIVNIVKYDDLVFSSIDASTLSNAVSHYSGNIDQRMKESAIKLFQKLDESFADLANSPKDLFDRKRFYSVIISTVDYGGVFDITFSMFPDKNYDYCIFTTNKNSKAKNTYGFSFGDQSIVYDTGGKLLEAYGATYIDEYYSNQFSSNGRPTEAMMTNTITGKYPLYNWRRNSYKSALASGMSDEQYKALLKSQGVETQPYKQTDTAIGTDQNDIDPTEYLSQFIFDKYTLPTTEKYLMRNGWGFWTLEDEYLTENLTSCTCPYCRLVIPSSGITGEFKCPRCTAWIYPEIHESVPTNYTHEEYLTNNTLMETHSGSYTYVWRWHWITNPYVLSEAVGNYDTNYQAAVDAFAENGGDKQDSPGLYFVNASPQDTGNANLDTARSAIETYETLRYGELHRPQLSLMLDMAKQLGHSYKNASIVARKKNEAVQVGTIYAHRYFTSTDTYDESARYGINIDYTDIGSYWNSENFCHYFIYVVDSIESIGNAFAGLDYYYVIIPDPNSKAGVRLTTLSKAELDIYTYKIQLQ